MGNLNVTLYIDIPSKAFTVQPDPLNKRDYVDLAVFELTDSIISANTLMSIDYEGNTVATAAVIFSGGNAIFPMNLNSSELIAIFAGKSDSYSDNFNILIQDNDNANILLNTLIPIKNIPAVDDSSYGGTPLYDDSLGNLTEDTSNILTIVGGGLATFGDVTLQVKTAATAQSGYLTSTDWNTFNAKSNLALGETSVTAYRGDRGKIAYDHTLLVTGNPHVVTATEVNLGNVTNESKATMFTSPTFTGTVTLATPFTLGAISVTTTGTQLNYLTNATGTTGTSSTNLVFSTSPTLVTPILGVATATSINKLTITAPATSAVLTVADGKTFTASNTLTLTGTDTSTLNIGTGGTLGTAAYLASGNLTESTSSVLTITGGTNGVLGNVTILVKTAATGQSGYLTSADWNTFNNKQDDLGFTAEDVANKVTSISSASTDTEYPSAKLLYDTVAGSGDMVLADVQSVTGLKTYDTSKLAVKGTSTGVTYFASVVSGATSYTLTLPSSNDTLVGKATTDTLTNKTLTSPAFNGTITGDAFLDEDDMASDSPTKLASQQSIKKYVDDNAGSSDIVFNDQTGTTYTLVLTDDDKMVTMSNASTNVLTVPLHASVAYSIGSVIAVKQIAAGVTTITGATGVTVNGVSAGSNALSAQYDTGILTYKGSDVWYLDITPASGSGSQAMYIEANIPNNNSELALHFELQIYSDATYDTLVESFNTSSSQANIQLFDGTDWVAMPAGGAIKAYYNNHIRFALQTAVAGVNYYTRIRTLYNSTGSTWVALSDYYASTYPNYSMIIPELSAVAITALTKDSNTNASAYHKHSSVEYDEGSESGAVSLDFSRGDYQQIATVVATPITSLTMTNSGEGDWLVIEIDNANATTVTINAIAIIGAGDTGTYLVAIGNVGGVITFANSKTAVV